MSTRYTTVSGNRTGVGLVILDFLFRRWVLTIVALTVLIAARFIAGRDILNGGRTTDATFFHSARTVRGHWWASAPGAARGAIRVGCVLALITGAIYPAWVLTAVGGTVAVLIWRGIRRWQHHRYVRDVLGDTWPAVAGIIGVDESEPPDEWLDIPDTTPNTPDTNGPHTPSLPDTPDNSSPDTATNTAPPFEIAVGIREADGADNQRAELLVLLFDQRYHRAHYALIDHAHRLVRLRVRPAEPTWWPSVADILNVSPGELAHDWMRLDMPTGTTRARRDLVVPDKVTVWVPPTTLLSDVTRAMQVLLQDQYGGEWVTDGHGPNRTWRRVELIPKPPKPTPPTSVSFTAEHPYAEETR